MGLLFNQVTLGTPICYHTTMSPIKEIRQVTNEERKSIDWIIHPKKKESPYSTGEQVLTILKQRGIAVVEFTDSRTIYEAVIESSKIKSFLEKRRVRTKTRVVNEPEINCTKLYIARK